MGKVKRLLPIVIEYDRQVKMYIAHCPETDVWTQAETRVKAREALTDALRCMLWSYRRHNKTGAK